MRLWTEGVETWTQTEEGTVRQDLTSIFVLDYSPTVCTGILSQDGRTL
uniref:Uncharacterized protein n=1 Tax=Anguilla anguilla TaxID=7936 RepID=A0A0E9W0L6_ANGAN